MSIVPAKVCQTLGLDAEFVGARIRLQFRGPVRWQGDFEARNTVSVPSTNALQVRLKGGQQRRSLDAVIGKAYVVVPCRGERLHRDNVRPHLAVGSGPGPFGRRGLFWMGRDTAFGLWRAGDEDALALIAFALPAAVDAVAAVWPLVAALSRNLCTCPGRQPYCLSILQPGGRRCRTHADGMSGAGRGDWQRRFATTPCRTGPLGPIYVCRRQLAPSPSRPASPHLSTRHGRRVIRAILDNPTSHGLSLTLRRPPLAFRSVALGQARANEGQSMASGSRVSRTRSPVRDGQRSRRGTLTRTNGVRKTSSWSSASPQNSHGSHGNNRRRRGCHGQGTVDDGSPQHTRGWSCHALSFVGLTRIAPTGAGWSEDHES
ncbi:hypothetical protein VFPBJ_03444 [Purpureocillium lilacinum]|uniref:Uncharacterized protein n=1 Tax=Purpureocillium lilacinum TaxID=33203 RepID=A0A179H353_PURLI|nr:hypothetical protein VFPBJ_03444 [Purpureocillium lilacinum]